MLGAIAVAATAIAAPFGTFTLAFPSRLLFWTAIIAWNVAKWHLWQRLVSSRFTGGRRAACYVAGALLLNLTLPLEIAFALEAVGRPAHVGFLATWAEGAGLALLIGALRLAWPRAAQAPAPADDDVTTALPRILERANVDDPSALLAMEAEDHYVRLHLAGGGKPLILYRFGDALADVAALDGEQVHRGAWIAAGAVAGAEREGRRWTLRLADGSRIAISTSFLGAARRRGWLGRMSD